MKVSIIIVCMNNMKNIYPCLSSIRNLTRIEYEVLLVAYMFSDENLQKIKVDFPWVTIIESKEVRGFSENNNLALKVAKGDYCFVLNDDTYFDTPVIDTLYDSMIAHQAVDIMSPNLYYPDGRAQFLGRPYLDAISFILSTLHIWGEENMRRKYRNRTGLYDIYNISGAAFIIKTKVFRQLGWFDEKYFFCPEDIALSTKAICHGYKICQNPSVKITHVGGGTSSPIGEATLPASFKGHLIFYSNQKYWKFWLICLIEYPIVFAKYVYFKMLFAIKKEEVFNISANSEMNTLITMGSSMTPKEIFIKYYSKMAK